MASLSSVEHGLVPTKEKVSHCPSVVTVPLVTDKGHADCIGASGSGVQERVADACAAPKD